MPDHQAPIAESAGTVTASGNKGRYMVQLISPGWGSSGYYSPKVLEQAAANRVIPAGTHMYADHPTDDEAATRPERSIKDLMGVTTTDAKLMTNGALAAEVQVLSPYRQLVDEAKGAIGVSIRGSASDIKHGVAEGREGRIIEGLAHVSSVDFVTRAGRGGKVLGLLESARPATDDDLTLDEADRNTITDLMLAEALAESVGSATHPADTERLMSYWAEGEGAAKIGWGHAGDYDKCVIELGKYVRPDEVHGLCQNLHQRATGFSAGKAPGEQHESAATPEAAYALLEAKYDASQLRQMVKDGHALSNPNGDPSYPIKDKADLANAVKAVGRGDSDHDRIRAHIVKRAKALGAMSMVPDNWQDPDGDGDNDASESATTHVPAARPGGYKKGATMPKIEIEESEHSRLTETAGRVTVLEAEKKAWEAERTTLRADLSKAQTDLTEAKAALIPNKDLREAIANLTRENDMLHAREVAAPMIAEALEEALIGESAKKRLGVELLNGITLKEGDGARSELDTAALTESINDKVRVAEAEAQELREAMGVGRPRGLGQTVSGGGLLVEQKRAEAEKSIDESLSRAFGFPAKKEG